MKTEIKTSSSRPIHVILTESGALVTSDDSDTIEYDPQEVKELRDFLIQLDLCD